VCVEGGDMVRKWGGKTVEILAIEGILDRLCQVFGES